MTRLVPKVPGPHVAPVAALVFAWIFLLSVVGPTVAKSPESIWDGVYTERQAARGRQIFQSECTSCHPAMDGDGDGGGADAPSLAGAEFLQRWAGRSVGDIFVLMRTTMPPNAAASLAREAYLDILAYLLKSNQYPAGSRELAAETALLESIVIEQKRP